jgi:hypothetical protein
MDGSILLSSAYFPPVSYISLFKNADRIQIEQEENYIKQTYRNRCRILGANGPETLTIPVESASFRKTRIKDVKIAYSKRWQQMQIRAFTSAYRSSAYFEYYFDAVEILINTREKYLLDFNLKSLEIVMGIMGLTKPVEFTSHFESPGKSLNDYRYKISPKIKTPENYFFKEYFQVFRNKFGFVPDLSILDLVFNAGPDSVNYLGLINVKF